MEIVIGWFILAIVAGIAASGRGRSGFGFFLLSLILSPLIGLILVFALPAKTGMRDEAGLPITPKTHVRCPDCREFVRKEARKCKHCGTTLIPQ